MAGEHLVFGIKGVPAFPLSVDNHPDQGLAILGGGLFGFRRHAAVGGAHDGRHAGRLKAVGNILFQQLVGRQDHHRAQLMQGVDNEPELVMPLEDEHHLIAFFDADGLKIVGGAAAFTLDIVESETAFGAVVGHMQERQLVRLPAGDGIHHIEGEIELIIVFIADTLQRAVLVLHRLNEVFIHAVLVVAPAGASHRRRLAIAMGDIFGGVEHHGVKLAVLPAHSNHAMGRTRIVIDGIAWSQHLAMGAHLHLQVAADDQIKLLALMGGQRDFPALGGLIVLRHGVQRLSNAVFIGRGHVVIGHAMGLLNALSIPRPGQGVGGQRGAAALDQVGHIHAEGQGAAVQKGEVQVALARFAGQVFRRGNAGFFGHLGRAQALHLAQLSNARRHFTDRQIKTGCNVCHVGSFSGTV